MVTLKRGFSDPAFAAGGQSQFDRVVDQLIEAAMDVLHHDRTEGSEVDTYERKMLSEKFCTILANESANSP